MNEIIEELDSYLRLSNDEVSDYCYVLIDLYVNGNLFLNENHNLKKELEKEIEKQLKDYKDNFNIVVRKETITRNYTELAEKE